MRWVGIAMSIFIPTGINMLWEKLLWGFTSGFLGAGGNLKAGLLGALGAGLFHGTHWLNENVGLFKNTLMHGLAKGFAGGLLSSLAGGKFGSGFLGAFAGGILGEEIGIGGESGTGTRVDRLVRLVRDAVIGGIASVLGGGKFKNGAISAAFARLYNDDVVMRLNRRELSTAIDELTEDVQEIKNIDSQEEFYSRFPTMGRPAADAGWEVTQLKMKHDLEVAIHLLRNERNALAIGELLEFTADQFAGAVLDSAYESRLPGSQKQWFRRVTGVKTAWDAWGLVRPPLNHRISCECNQVIGGCGKWKFWQVSE